MRPVRRQILLHPLLSTFSFTFLPTIRVLSSGLVASVPIFEHSPFGDE